MVCGDSRVIQSYESCDDGNTRSGDGCSFNCTTVCIMQYLLLISSRSLVTPVTPPGVQILAIQPVEMEFWSLLKNNGNSYIYISLHFLHCSDDGPANATHIGDGCTTNCIVEAGWSCSSTSPSYCIPGCGNNQIDGSELCDHGSAFNVSKTGCNDRCTVVPGWSCTNNLCVVSAMLSLLLKFGRKCAVMVLSRCHNSVMMEMLILEMDAALRVNLKQAGIALQTLRHNATNVVIPRSNRWRSVIWVSYPLSLTKLA